MIEYPGNIKNDSNLNVESTDRGGSPKGGSGPIDTPGDIGKDNMGFSADTSNHNSTDSVPKGSGIQSPGNIQGY